MQNSTSMVFDTRQDSTFLVPSAAIPRKRGRFPGKNII